MNWAESFMLGAETKSERVSTRVSMGRLEPFRPSVH